MKKTGMPTWAGKELGGNEDRHANKGADTRANTRADMYMWASHQTMPPYLSGHTVSKVYGKINIIWTFATLVEPLGRHLE